ncbi:MAG: hypothetical protein A3F10_05505 [Coxiella sp. RIFCSPHIGHO2_12_FULL_42_15]|nr:MAG: hypothetical protein A3F10_05505 [Coxiella sp. RIFCSPHIGHO2_12_FULL_42_15]
MSQCKIILAELKKSPLTAAQAIEKHNIYRLAARINDLRKRGYTIATHMHTTYRADGKRSYYAEYRYIH